MKDFLLERIANGWYDDKLKTLIANSETQKNYPVWKVATERLDICSVGGTVAIPPTESYILPKGVTSGLCAPSLRLVVPYLGLLVIPYINKCDVGFGKQHITACKKYQSDAIRTRVGDSDHYVAFYAIVTTDTPLFLVEIYSEGFSPTLRSTEDFVKAEAIFTEEVRNEHICRNS